MVEPDKAAEERLLRSIRRRNVFLGLLITVPILSAWWLLSHWLIRRYGIEPHLAMFGTLFVAGPGIAVLLRRLGLDQVRDPRMTPRLDWLMKEWTDRTLARARRLRIAAVVMAILLLGPIMLFDYGNSSDLTDGWAVLMILMGTGGPNLLWRLPKTMDELEQAHYLAATHRAYAVTVLLCVGALILDRYWPGRLPGVISMSLLIGILVQQTALEMSYRRAVPRDA